MITKQVVWNVTQLAERWCSPRVTGSSPVIPTIKYEDVGLEVAII